MLPLTVFALSERNLHLSASPVKSRLQEAISNGYPLKPPKWMECRPKNRRVVAKGSKSSNDNCRDRSSDLSFTQKIPSGPASPLRTVIGRIGPENGGISRWEDQVSTYHWWRNGGQENMIVHT